MADFHRRRTPPGLVPKRAGAVLSGARLTASWWLRTARKATFAPDKPRPWAQTQILEPNALNWNLDLAPDGKRFVVAPRPEATGSGQNGSVHVTVLLNFFDELRRRVPAGSKN